MLKVYELDVLVRKSFFVKADSQSEAEQIIKDELNLYDFEFQQVTEIPIEEVEEAKKLADEVIE